ncbi:MAG: glycine--tRNA ligase subunit beta [Actinobacteria bacterium]|nr:glycine--tRNA ligase subunit beta [Actinomycetota bacterium]MCL5883631.1 glycine--tRNA ligase subunit beta [Actinomycetota bacterium]
MTAAETQRDFLFEIGTEELPAAAARSAAAQVGPLAEKVLTRHHLDADPEGLSVWVTPRRIAIYIRELPVMQQSQESTDRGPIASKAFDADGKPTRAAEGFARAKGVAVGDLELREHDGQQFVFAIRRKEGLPAVEILPDVCREILLGINFPKTMRWQGEGMRFSRPVRWLAAKFGSDTVEFEIHGIVCGGVSRGHRFLSAGPVPIESASKYREALRAAKVIVDQEERRAAILEGLALEAGKRGASFIDPAGELEEVMYLVEYPSVQSGDYGEEHLRLPARVLTTCMQSHQRYFPLTAEDGSMMAGFLYVMNGDPASAPEITLGNERVLEGRIEDAEFSFDKDIATGIDTMADRLSAVVFHRRLGSLADKSERLVLLSARLGNMAGLDEAGVKIAVSAARLAKADQVSIMVQEFADLEGYIGSVYAEMEAYPADLCTAIAEHFLPAFAGGALPSTAPGAVLAIADKVDNIVGAFGVDEVPTGSRDPYGIRRAGAGIAAISREYRFDFNLDDLFAAGQRLYMDQKADITPDLYMCAAAREFVFDRIQNRMAESGMPVEIVEAARAAGIRSTLRLENLAEALDAFRAEPAFDDLHTAYFRCTKIAAKAGADLEGAQVDEKLFEEDSERALFRAVAEIEPEVTRLTGSRDYAAALKAAAAIRPVVDRFFDEVMVMAEDEKVRNNRLALVLRAAAMLRRLGDPMRVAAAPK